jgi:ABC-type nitrate/sulfonate/bicarbonate transport system substrate-binding protein
MRRLFPLAALLCASLLAACGGEGADTLPLTHLTDATLMLDFTPNAVHAGIYSAIARGYDRAEHVRLHVQVPGSSTDSMKLLLAGRVDYAVMDIHDLAIACDKVACETDRGINAVMPLVQRPLASVLTAPAITNPRQLEGKKVGVTGLPSDDAVLDSIVAGAGGDPKKVKRVTIGFNAVPALLGGRVAGATAFWNDEGVALHAKRPGTHEFRVDAYGAPAYPELVVVTSSKRLDANARLTPALIRALTRGYEFAVAHPAAAVADLTQQVPGLDRDEVATQLRALEPALAPPGEKIGEFDDATLRRWAQWERRFGIVARTPNVDVIFGDPSLEHD